MAAPISTLSWRSEPRVTLETLSLAAFDSAALISVVAGAELEHKLLPGGGSDMNLLHCVLPNSVINRGIYAPAVLVNGVFSEKTVTIGTMLRQRQPTLVNGVPVEPGTIQFYAENTELCYRAWPDGTWLTFAISRERILQFCMEHFGVIPELPPRNIGHMGAPGNIATRLRTGLCDLDQSLHTISREATSPRLGQSVEHDILLQISHMMCEGVFKRGAGEPRRIRHCTEIMRDAMALVEQDPGELLDLHSLSTATGLSPRTLQRTFQTECGLTPQEWFRVERLNRVRNELLNDSSEGSITRAATRWGFFHLSRFAQYYRDLFGERPSDTLRHGRVQMDNRSVTH